MLCFQILLLLDHTSRGECHDSDYFRILGWVGGLLRGFWRGLFPVAKLIVTRANTQGWVVFIGHSQRGLAM